MRGFISYSHEDRKVCDELRKPLKPLCRMYGIEEFWFDEATATGRCFRAGYLAEIDRAEIFITLISSNSLWSNEIMENELPAIIRKWKAGGCLWLPVIVDDCLWPSVVGTVTASPRDKHLSLLPLDQWKPRRQGINQTAKQLDKAIGEFLGKKPITLVDQL